MPNIPIVFCIAGDYWQHAAVAIYSASRFVNKSSFHLFFETESLFWRDKIRGFVEAHGNTISFHRFDTRMVQGFREIDYLGLGTYFRIFLPEIFPEAEKILYLDSDLVVMDALNPLLEWEMEGFTVAARPSCEMGLTAMCSRNLGRSPDIPYLNAGVLLIDAKKWRSEGFTQQAVAFIKSQPEKLTYADQCAINHILKGRFAFLSPKWNASHVDWRNAPASDAIHFSRLELEQAMAAPKIIHFNGPSKPWEWRDTHERRAEYRKLRRLAEGRWYYVADDFPQAVPGMLLEKCSRFQAGILFAVKQSIKSALKFILPKKMGMALAAAYRARPGRNLVL
jgi:lipopolysaccharide biosynthesis glycosyltransferase